MQKDGYGSGLGVNHGGGMRGLVETPVRGSHEEAERFGRRVSENGRMHVARDDVGCTLQLLLHVPVGA